MSMFYLIMIPSVLSQNQRSTRVTLTRIFTTVTSTNVETKIIHMLISISHCPQTS